MFDFKYAFMKFDIIKRLHFKYYIHPFFKDLLFEIAIFMENYNKKQNVDRNFPHCYHGISLKYYG